MLTQKTSSLPEAIFQFRKGIVKDIWIAKESGERVRCHIESPLSSLRFVPQGEDSHLIESLTEVDVALDSGLLSSFRAQSATYDYHDNILSMQKAGSQ